MRKFENVEYTKSFELLFLLASTVAVFFGMIFLLNRIMNFGLIKGILAIVIAGIYFIIIKKKFIVKISDFELKSNQLEWNNKIIDFKNIEYYKIHWTKGAGIKFKLKNGKTFRLSSNDNFCDSEKFVSLCNAIDSELEKVNNKEIVRKQSFFETKQGYYFAITITVLIVFLITFKILTKDKINIQTIALILVSLVTIWSGVRWIKK